MAGLILSHNDTGHTTSRTQVAALYTCGTHSQAGTHAKRRTYRKKFQSLFERQNIVWSVCDLPEQPSKYRLVFPNQILRAHVLQTRRPSEQDPRELWQSCNVGKNRRAQSVLKGSLLFLSTAGAQRQGQRCVLQKHSELRSSLLLVTHAFHNLLLLVTHAFDTSLLLVTQAPYISLVGTCSYFNPRIEICVFDHWPL